MSDPTYDIKDTFIMESVGKAFEQFEDALGLLSTKKPQVKVSPGLLKTNAAECVYKLDNNTPPLAFLRMNINAGDKNKRYEFQADTVGTGILNMRLVWRASTGGNRTFSSEELAEYCFDEILNTSPVA